MGTQNYNFTYLDPESPINLVGDTTTFLDEIDATIKQVADIEVDDVQNINSRIDEITEERYVAIIGDSYCADGVIPSAIAQRLGLTAINMSVRGAGFCNAGITGDGTFKEQAQRLKADARSSKLDRIIVYGGVNDIANYDVDSILNAAATFGAYMLSNFPDVEINVFVTNATPSYYSYLARKHEDLVTTLKRAGFASVDGYAYLWFFNNPGQLESDGLHPTDAGKKYIVGCMLSSMNGNPSIRRTVDVASIGTVTSQPRDCFMQDGIVYLETRPTMSSTTVGDFTDFLDFSSVNNGIIIPNHYSMACVPLQPMGGPVYGMVRNNKHLSIYNQGTHAGLADFGISASFPVCPL